jgi:N-hydroxyarylamine O-acetyltransferase
MFLTSRWAHLGARPGFGGGAARAGPEVVAAVADGPTHLDDHMHGARDGEWVLEGRVKGVMTALWTSSLEPQFPVDFALANHYVATFPESPFATRLMIRALTPDGRVSAMNRDVTVVHNGVAETRRLADRTELRALLERYFGFELPEVERLRVPSVPEWA